MSKHKITQEYIAKELHISRKTVSKVFNNAEGIKEETKSLVLDKAKELGYSHMNSELLIQLEQENEPSADYHMDTIAFVCFDESFWGSYWTSILSGLENTLRNTNANLQFIVITQEEHQSNALPASLTKWEIDGIITCGVFSSDYYVKLKSLGIPMVTLDVSPELTSINAICDVVMVENEPAVYTLTKNLIEKGHRDICFVGSIESSLSFQERWNGFCRAMREYGLPCEPASNLTEYSETKYYNCSEIIQKLSDRKRTPSAFVCGNDSVACVFNALTKPPYNYLPSNIQLTGFDHIAEYSSLLDSCPTVEIYPEEIGKQLAELLQWRRQNPGRQFRTVRLNVKPILR